VPLKTATAGGVVHDPLNVREIVSDAANVEALTAGWEGDTLPEADRGVGLDSGCA